MSLSSCRWTACIRRPGDPNEDTEGGFRRGGRQRPYFDEILGTAAGEGMAGTDAHLFGRKTYEIMAAYWPPAPAGDPYGKHLNSVAKYIASRTLRSVDWQGSTLIEGDVAAEVAKLKEQPGKNIAVMGSGDLVQTLMANDLVDEYSLMVFPIVLGSGKRLFREAPELIEPATVAAPDAGSRMVLTVDVDDVDAVCEQLTARGVELLNGPMDRPWGIRTASFRDPSGHIWEIAK